MQDQIQIPFKNKMITLHFEEFDDNIDVDLLCKIDYSNMYAELITIPALMNRVGLWKAEAENLYDINKLDFEIYKAKRAHHYRRELKEVPNAKNDIVKKAKNNQEVDEDVITDEGVILRNKKMLRLRKEAAMMDSLYWAIKSKEQKINRIGEKMNLAPEEFEREIITGKWNGILIQAREKLIKA